MEEYKIELENKINQTQSRLEEIRQNHGVSDLESATHKMSDEERNDYINLIQELNRLQQQYTEQVKKL